MKKEIDLLEPAVIYTRYSSDHQRDESIEQQIAVCERYAKNHNLKIVGTYTDRALTGTVDRRPGFLQMIRDSGKRRWNYVIVYALDRFARNRYDSAHYKHELKNNGVRVLSATEEIPDDPIGVVMESLLEGMAEYYSKELSVKVRRGLEYNAQQCKVYGRPPFGYEKAPDGTYAINEAEAAIVREIYRRVLDGDMLSEIIRDLNNRGIRTKSGQKWQPNSFSKILTNERYTGVYIWRDVRIPGGMPEIISRKEFDAVQFKTYIKPNPRKDKSGKVPQRRRRDAGVYLLTGKLYCGECKEAMVGISGTGKSGALHYYYACRGKRHGSGCHKQNVAKDYIEETLARAVWEKMLNDSAIRALADAAIENQKDDTESLELENLRAQLTAIDKQLGNLLKAIESGIITETTRERMMQLEDEKRMLHGKIAAVESICTGLPSREEIVAMLEVFREGDIHEKDFQATLLDAFLVAAYLYDDHIDIVFTPDGEAKTTYCSDLNGNEVSEKLDSLEHPSGVRISPSMPHLVALYEHQIIVVSGLLAFRKELI